MNEKLTRQEVRAVTLLGLISDAQWVADEDQIVKMRRWMNGGSVSEAVKRTMKEIALLLDVDWIACVVGGGGRGYYLTALGWKALYELGELV